MFTDYTKPNFDISIPDYTDLSNYQPVKTVETAVKDPVIQTFNTGPLKHLYTGKIVDEFGDGIPYATLNSVNDNTIYTETDDKGNYYFNVPPTDFVVIRQVGYEPKQLLASDLTKEVVLQMNSANQLDEVVVTANPKPPTTPPKNYKPLIITGVIAAIIGGAIYVSKNESADLGLAAGKTCNNRTKCKGLNKNGKLKKGYKFAKGGKVVKSKATKKRKPITKKGLNAGVVEVTI